LLALCSTIRNADTEFSELSLRIRQCVLKAQSHFEVIRRMGPLLSESHQIMYNEMAQTLSIKFQAASVRLQRATKAKKIQSELPFPSVKSPSPERVSKLKFLLVKSSLERTIQELENWELLFNPSWMLMALLSGSKADLELAAVPTPSGDETSVQESINHVKSIRKAAKWKPNEENTVYLRERGLSTASITPIERGDLSLATFENGKQYIIDIQQCPIYASIDDISRDVNQLAHKLSMSKSHQTRLLDCKGVVKESDQFKVTRSFTFVMRIPKGVSSKPISLRSCLLLSDTSHSLSERFRLAYQVATAVSSVHTYGFVHKNIRPDVTLLFRDGTSEIGSAYLAGFSHIRGDKSKTNAIGTSSWMADLYQHPDRQGAAPETRYVMQHDIYSLGVCLLEIGLWTSLVDYTSSTPQPSPLIQFQTTPTSEQVKTHLLNLSSSALPKHMGTRYADLVKICLTCLDDNNPHFVVASDEDVPAEDELQVGIRYIESVCHFP
jgi:hypothetical protein